ncbi:hypothetical protein [Nocardiopsis composta]|uniref:Uncharacterized protein n=1 Tax=Nocardiopsis composta TaxID=157465 RepID=A0A7W8VG13_9ACTN|nr:hypothetical protein [Nocardiopsis composta]MBB5435146.1 hypothetical protein [Nocardiopsis composta]
MRRRNPRPRLRPGSGPGTLVPPRPFRCPRPAPARRPAAPEATPANTWTAPARAAYRKRLIELDAEIAEAESDADPGRIDRLRREHGLLTGEPSGVLGLGGRPRTGGDPAERARKAVTMRIRTALRAIREAGPALALHLDRSVATGRYCAYRPEHPVVWRSAPRTGGRRMADPRPGESARARVRAGRGRRRPHLCGRRSLPWR